jgi:hypothetical protein
MFELAQAGLFAGMGALMLVFWTIALLGSIFWIWMLVDCLTSDLPSGEKLIWALVIIFLHFIGALIYYVAGRPHHGGGQGRHLAT